jgi:molecular chaperone DnaK
MNIEDSAIVGIDLGTTNSLVAVFKEGRVQVLEENGEALLPSVVARSVDGQLIVGQAAKNQLSVFPDRTIASIKRKMGQATHVPLGDESFTPQEISAVILKRLKLRAEKSLGCEVTRAVITVPAFFDENQRQATRQAGELAGLQVERIINEPTAASLVYHASSPERRHMIVYDLGGGTFDVSIVRIEAGVVEVLSSKGDTQLGGDDFDELLTKHVADRVLNEFGINLTENLATRWRLLRACERAKCDLSFETRVRLAEEYIAEKDGQPFHLDITIDRSDYEALIAPMIDRTIECVFSAIRDSSLSIQQIDELILVGGSTRTPMVQELLRERFRREPRWSVNPDLAVALGAAMQGAIQRGDTVGPVLVDVATHTLGVAVLDSTFQGEQLVFIPILRRNSPLPARYERAFSKLYPAQETVEIEVYQGESSILSQNQSLGSFLLEGLKYRDNTLGAVLVRFQLTLDGVLQVTASEEGTQNTKSLLIKNALTKMKLDSDASSDRLLSLLHEQESDELGEVIGTTLAGGFYDSPAYDKETDESEGFESDDGSSVRMDGAETGTKMSHLIRQAKEMLPSLDGEASGDVQRILSAIEEARANSDVANLEKLEFELDDLLFYLAD